MSSSEKHYLIKLKIFAEKVLVQERILNHEMSRSTFCFADAQTCLLLKEYAIQYFLLSPRDILGSKRSKCLRDSAEMLSEIIMLMDGRDEDAMRVTN